MKRYLTISVMLFCVTFVANAQAVNDSVFLGAQYANQLWYSLANDEQGTAPKNNWDIAFEMNSNASSVLINIADELWIYPNGDTTAWATLDTAGMAGWTKLYNSDTSWSVGAFNANADPNNDFDLGWGVYDLSTHYVTGDSIYVVKLADGSFKKLWILRLANARYEFRYAALDGSGDATKIMAKADYQGKNFGYFSLANGTPANREPISANWDLTFAQYTAFVPMAYPVTGVLSNKGVQVAKAYPVANAETYNDYTAHTFATAINTIGYNWKTFNNTTFMYELADSIVYFIKDKTGDVWKLIFTCFGGSSTGKFVFSKERLTGGANGIGSVSANNNFFTVYPNPATTGTVTLIVDARQTTNATIAITDVQGKTVLQQKIDFANGLVTYNISTTGLKNGFYTVQVKTENAMQTHKLIVNN